MAYKSFYYSLLLVVQVIAESFPFSSSTHVKLFKFFFKKNLLAMKDDELSLSFEDFAHGCTAIGLIPFFINFTPNFNFLVLSFKWVVIVDLITALGYFFLKPFLEHFSPTPGLILSAIFLGLLNFSVFSNQTMAFNYNYFFLAIIVGFLHLLAFVPGISRLAIVYVFLKFVGLSNIYAWYFSWIGMWPLLVLRSLKGFYQLSTKNISIKFLIGLFLFGCILGYLSLTLMYNLFLDSQFIFMYPLIMGILCLIIYQD